jgi:protein-glucosylgalactosylhydroxylysine glucosidase
MANMSRQIRYNDLEFYSGVTDPNGPAMTWSMTAIGYLEYVSVNQSALAKANQYFALSYANAQPPFQVWTETPQGGTVNFITGVGGFLQGVMFGYGGIRLSNVMSFNPILPPNTTEMTMRGV